MTRDWMLADGGGSDPVTAANDVLVTLPAERIVLFARPVSDRRYDERMTPGHGGKVVVAGPASGMRSQNR
jgi:hypothetical protein